MGQGSQANGSSAEFLALTSILGYVTHPHLAEVRSVRIPELVREQEKHSHIRAYCLPSPFGSQAVSGTCFH